MTDKVYELPLMFIVNLLLILACVVFLNFVAYNR